MNKQHTKLATLVEDIEIQNEYLKNEIEEIYEMIVGYNGLNRYTQKEIIDKIQKLKQAEQARNILAYENRSLAEFIKHNDNTLTDSDIGDIACGAPDVWDSFINKNCRRFNEWELMEDVSLLYLTKALPTDHTEWSDSQLDSFLNEHVSEAYEDYDADGLWRLIEDTSYRFHQMMKDREEK